MRTTFALLKSSASSNRWKARQASDPYVRARSLPLNKAPLGADGQIVKKVSNTAYRSRSSFKLLSLCEKHPYLLTPRNRKYVSEFDPAHKRFNTDTEGSSEGGSGDPAEVPAEGQRTPRGPMIVVDLGAAPGGWSQVASKKIGENGKVFACDILDFPPLSGVTIIQGDFLSPSVQAELKWRVEEHKRKLTNSDFGLVLPPTSTEESDEEGRKPDTEGMVDLVMSDMMAPMCGHRTRDIQSSLDLVQAATMFALKTLKVGKGDNFLIGGRKRYPGGNFIVKYFAHPDLDEFKREVLIPRFRKVLTEKPKESRSGGREQRGLLGVLGLPRDRPYLDVSTPPTPLSSTGRALEVADEAHTPTPHSRGAPRRNFTAPLQQRNPFTKIALNSDDRFARLFDHSKTKNPTHTHPITRYRYPTRPLSSKGSNSGKLIRQIFE